MASGYDCTSVTKVFVVYSLFARFSAAAEFKANTQLDVASASILFSYRNNVNSVKMTRDEITGRYALHSPVDVISGRLIHVLTSDGANHACGDVINAPSSPPSTPEVSGDWLALVQRGECKFDDKMTSAALVGNASGVIVYDHSLDGELVTMDHSGKCHRRRVGLYYFCYYRLSTRLFCSSRVVAAPVLLMYM